MAFFQQSIGEGLRWSEMHFIRQSVLVSFFLFISLAEKTSADVYMKVTGATVKKAQLALGKIFPLTGVTADPTLALNLENQFRADLEFANLFEFIAPEFFNSLDKASNLQQINYSEWVPTGAAFFLTSGYKIENGKLVLEVGLYDIPGQKKILATRYTYTANQYPRLVHSVTEDILEKLTGEKGLFRSRILMICKDLERPKGWSKKKAIPSEVYVVDPDGRNLTQLTTDDTISLSPDWAPNGKIISYTQYQDRKINGLTKVLPVLKTHNLLTGKRTILSDREGMNSGAAWSPGGELIAATLSFSGRPEIYLLNVYGKGSPIPLSRTIQWRQVSGTGFQPNFASLLFDVEASWAPDGNKIVFSSARTGHPMIYIVDLKSRIASQLTFAGTYNSSPAWSPNGDKIVFAAQRSKNGNFDLFLIDPDGGNLSRMTFGESQSGVPQNSEDPDWAPTGRHLTYATNESGRYSIVVSTVDGSVKRQISPAGKECTSPAWSGYDGL